MTSSVQSVHIQQIQLNGEKKLNFENNCTDWIFMTLITQLIDQ